MALRELGRIAVTLAVVASLSACDKEESVKVDVKTDNFCDQVAKVACENIFTCCTGKKIEEMFGVTISTQKDKCKRDVKLACEDSNAQLLYALAKGTVSVDAKAATACLASFLVGDQCFQLAADDPTVEPCKTPAFTGLQGVGKACVYSIECVANTYCGPDRKCRALPKIDEACDNLGPQPCSTGLYCDEDYTCQFLRKSGEECDGINPCAEALYCSPEDDGDLCRSLKTVGASCAGDGECASGYCIPGLCSDGNQCFSDDDCDGTCSDTGKPCSGDADCAGTCTKSGDPCLADWDCYEADDTCEHPKCEGSCHGQPVCGEEYFEINYCTLGQGMLN